MPVKDNEKNKVYVKRHSIKLREIIGDTKYRKRETEARALKLKKEKERKALEAITLPPIK